MQTDYYNFLMYLKKYIPIVKTLKIKNPIEINGRYILKINSMEHKARIGGVIKNIKNKKELSEAIKKLSKISKPPFILQKQIDGFEFIIGIKKDITFGYIIMFGIGGTLAEIYKDVSFRKCPINEKDATEMINETKISKIFSIESLNKKELIKFLINVSKIPKRINFNSLDINPVIVNKKIAIGVDARLN